jgi:hypothetical protein
MTERTIRTLAKELAGKFYEQNRTPGFRIAFPTFRDYIRGQWHRTDGSIIIDKPGWLYFVEPARKMLVHMLTRKDVHENLKASIMDALIEENAKATSPQARQLFQKGMQDGK